MIAFGMDLDVLQLGIDGAAAKPSVNLLGVFRIGLENSELLLHLLGRHLARPLDVLDLGIDDAALISTVKCFGVRIVKQRGQLGSH
jgi:hypothetical protein